MTVLRWIHSTLAIWRHCTNYEVDVIFVIYLLDIKKGMQLGI